MAHLKSSSGLPGQPGATSSSPQSNDVVVIKVKGGDQFSFRIDNPVDKQKVEELIYEIATSGERGPHIDVVRQLAHLLRLYDLNETLRFLEFTKSYGIIWEIRGDVSKDHFKAKEAYEKSSQNDWLCGNCKLGRCYAEGRGCQKDITLAKKYLKAATAICSEAEQFLDWYGLR